MRTCVRMGQRHDQRPSGAARQPHRLPRGEPDFKLRRLALDQLEAGVEDAAEFLVRIRVESKLARLDGAKLARLGA